jgi:hypothetical protein
MKFQHYHGCLGHPPLHQYPLSCLGRTKGSGCVLEPAKVGGVWKRAYGRVDPHGHPVVPFSEATYERLSHPAMALFHKLVEEAAGPGGVSRASFVACSPRELSVCLCRSIFFMYRASVGVLAKVSGTGFRAVMDVPTYELVVYLGCCFWRWFPRPLYVYVLCCPVCSFPLCMALPSETC